MSIKKNKTSRKDNINYVSLHSLKQVKGIGHALAVRIHDGGVYSSMKELKDIEGVGDVIFSRLDEMFECTPWDPPSMLYMSYDKVWQLKDGEMHLFQGGVLKTNFATESDPTNTLGFLEISCDWLNALPIEQSDQIRQNPLFVKNLVDLVDKKGFFKFSGTAFVIGNRSPFDTALTSGHCVAPRQNITSKDYVALDAFLKQLTSVATQEEQAILSTIRKAIENVESTTMMVRSIRFHFQKKGPYPSQIANVTDWVLHPDYVDGARVVDASCDLAVLKFDKSFTPQGPVPKITRLKGTSQELDAMHNISIFGYLRSDFTNLDGSGVPSNCFIRGSQGDCVQSTLHSHNWCNQFLTLQYKQKHAVIVVRGEFSSGHSGSPAIVQRNGKNYVIGIVSRAVISRDRVPDFENLHYADCAVTGFTNEKVDWIRNIVGQNCPQIGKTNASSF